MKNGMNWRNAKEEKPPVGEKEIGQIQDRGDENDEKQD